MTRARDLLRAIDQAALLVDGDGWIEGATPSCAAALDLESGSSVAGSLLDFVTASLRELKSYLERCRAADRPVHRTFRRRERGRSLPLHCAGRRAGADRVLVVVTSARHRLLGGRSSNRIGAAITQASHELRTPLNAILGWAQLLQSRPLEGVDARAVDAIFRNARRQSRCIDAHLRELAEWQSGESDEDTAAESEDHDAPARAESGALTAPRPLVLVVEDDVDSREMVEETLAVHGYRVRSAADGAEALRDLTEHRPDVIVSDIDMPGMDGLEFVRSVRQLPSPEFAMIPAIALTAFQSPEDRGAVADAGFQVHLVKPVDAPRLLREIAELIGARHGLSSRFRD